MRWYVNRNGITEGPFEEPAIIDMIKGSKDMRLATVRAEDGGDWMKLETSPFATVLPAPKAEYVTWKQTLVVVGTAVLGFTWLIHRVLEPSEVVKSVDALPPAKSSDDAAARDTADAIRATYSSFCAIADAQSKWDDCHDHTKGYSAVLKCAQDARNMAYAVTFAAPRTTSACGSNIVSSTSTIIKGMRVYLDDTVTWLTVRAVPLKKALATRSMSDACDDIDCSTLPFNGGDGKYSDASLVPITSIECTKDLFQCGRARDNVCWINKVASRLGIVCEGDSVMTDDPLFVRSTGTRIQ